MSFVLPSLPQESNCHLMDAGILHRYGRTSLSLYKRHEEARREAYRKGAWTAVIKYGEAGLKTDPEDIKALNDLAYAYYKKAQYDRALEMCERIYHLHPCEDLASQAKELGTRYMRHHEVLAEMYFLRGNDEAALGICEKLKPLDPLFSRKYVIESQIRLRQGNLQAAARQYGEMGIKCPHHYKEALNGLFEIARDNPLEEPVFREIFLLYESHNEVADAISRHEQLYRDGRTDAANFYILAHLYHFEKANKNEIALIEQQMLSHPDDAGLYALLARTYQAMQKQSGAKSCKEQALRLAPDKSDDFQRLWEPVEAEKAENQETRTPPRALEIQEKSWWQQSKRHDKAREQAYQQGSWHDVIRHGEEELRQDAGNIRAMNDLAYAYYKKSEFDRALDLCKAIYRQHPCDDLSQQARELGP
ncbi:MAG: tetratricopeptide repeat protein, partial [Flavobacteriales bacterium]